MRRMQQVADGVWVLRYPLPVLGTDFGRVVTVIRLRSGRIVIHSTAPFTPEDVAAIQQLGEPGWLVDGTLFHDSFAEEGRRVFPQLPYLAPPGFEKVAKVATKPLLPEPAEWEGELDVFPLGGMPKVREHVFFHRPSGTLIVCDFLFNLGASASPLTRFFARHVMRLRNGIGMSFFFRLMIKDRAAFRESVRPILACDFHRIIVGHGDIIEREAKQQVAKVLDRVRP